MFPWWDWIFETYAAQPEGGHESMTLGLAGLRDRKHLTPFWMLAAPFLSRDSDSARTDEVGAYGRPEK
jgi:sterol desaturase/sphingolipid hydroxylase (fatty acid hydroxylase superfamily)